MSSRKFLTYKNKMFTFKNLSKIISNITPQITKRNYHIIQPLVESVVSSHDEIKLNDITKNVMLHSSILYQNIPVSATIHKLDLFTRTEFQKYDFETVVQPKFGIPNFFLQFPNSGIVCNATLLEQKKLLYSRGNAITEICAANILPKVSNVTTVDIAVCWNNPINMTNQNEPDFGLAVLLYNGCIYKYHADFKLTNLMSFTQKLNGLHAGKIYYNVYYLYDCPKDYKFGYNERLLLKIMYYDSLQHHFSVKNPHALALSKENKLLIDKFMLTGCLNDYNKISLNTPKFLIPQNFIDNF